MTNQFNRAAEKFDNWKKNLPEKLISGNSIEIKMLLKRFENLLVQRTRAEQAVTIMLCDVDVAGMGYDADNIWDQLKSDGVIEDQFVGKLSYQKEIDEKSAIEIAIDFIEMVDESI